MRRILALLASIALFYSNPAISEDLDRAFEAGKVAAHNFENNLREQKEKIMVDNNNRDLISYVYDYKNYSIGLAQSSNIYIVVFSLRKNRSGEEILGGGARYEVDASSLEIKNFKFYE